MNGKICWGVVLMTVGWAWPAAIVGSLFLNPVVWLGLFGLWLYRSGRGAPAPIPTISANPTSPESATTALTALAELRGSGHLTEAEFSDAKSAILGGLTHPSEEAGQLADGALAAPGKQSRWSYYSRGSGSR